MLGIDRQHGSKRKLEHLSLEEIQAFLEASEEVGFKGRNREEVYAWMNHILRGQRYQELTRSGRGLVRRYVEEMTGLSRAQVTRLITLYLRGCLKSRVARVGQSDAGRPQRSRPAAHA